MNNLSTYFFTIAVCIILAGCGHHHHKRPYIFVSQTEGSILLIETPTSGHVDSEGDVDLYSVVLLAGTTYRISTTNLSADMDTVVRLFNSSGALIAENDNASEEGLSSLIEILIPETGVYTVAVSHKDLFAVTGMYDLLVEVIEEDDECPKLHHDHDDLDHDD